jgi:hypothetical protein
MGSLRLVLRNLDCACRYDYAERLTKLQGFVLHDALKHVPFDAFINLSNNVLGAVNASEILAAYQITQDMEPNLFWTRLQFLMGDVMFSEPLDKLVKALASQKGSNQKKVYRYTMTVRNPFPGSLHHQIPGHHFIDMLILFRALHDGYPTQRLKDISEGFMKRWIQFGAGLEPRDEYKLDAGDQEGKLMIVSGSEGWILKSKKQDEVESMESEEGERRYEGWETIGKVMKRLAGGEKGVVGGENARLE